MATTDLMGDKSNTNARELERRSKSTYRNAPRTRARILAAASKEFAAKGLGGARMESIAKQAGCNKALIHHYFSNKDTLFKRVLEAAYEDIRAAEKNLKLTHREPIEAMRELVGLSFDYVNTHPEFVSLINDENLHGGIHVASSQKAREINSPLVRLIETVLKRGEAEHKFRGDVDPTQLYVSIASLCYFYIANKATLSVIFDLPTTPSMHAVRRQHAIDVILGYLRPES